MDYKNLGPFIIIRVINNIVYKLKLPELIRGIYLIFHLVLLYYDNQDPLPGQIIKLLPPVFINKKKRDYNTLEIINSRINKRRNNLVLGIKKYLIYKVKYIG